MRSSETVRTLLEFLRDSDAIRFVHQRVSTVEELHYYFARWAGLSTYPVLYLAMHGDRNRVLVGGAPVTLTDLTRSETEPLDLSGKCLYFGSCASLRVSDAQLRALKKTSKARAVMGYTKSVDWFEAAGFEVILLSELSAKVTDSEFHVDRAVRRLRTRHRGLVETLGFRSEPPYLPA